VSDTRPNVLLITTDQQRYDTVGPSGMAQARTPRLDVLAERGAFFRNAFCQNPVCIPSRACLMTGRYTHQHGVDYMEQVIDDTPGLPVWELTIQERLQHAGYRTAAFGKIHMMPERGFHEQQVTGGKGARWRKSAGLPVGLGPLGRDYAAWLEERHPGAYETIYARRREPDYAQYATAAPFPLPLEEYVDYWTAQNTIDFLERDHDRPFFVWCGFCGPHPPCDPPAPYDAMYPEDEVGLPPNYGVLEDGSPRETSPQQDAVARRFCAYYWGLVTLIDDQLGRILDAMERRGLLDSTLIIFTSDHGEMMFEFGRTGKSRFYEPVIRMPLILVPPGGLSEGHQPDGLVETFDIAPTVLDYCGADVPAEMSAASLRLLVEGRGRGKEMVLSEFTDAGRQTQTTCVRTECYKYWHESPRGDECLFDLESDPLERHNVAADPECRAEVDRHRLLMLERLARTGARPLRPGSSQGTALR
jgi:arylsulfatase A-like enzyme